MLQRRQALDQPRTPLVNEQPRSDPVTGVTEPVKDFRPPIYTIRVRAPQRNPELPILGSHRGTVTLFREHIRAGHKSF